MSEKYKQLQKYFEPAYDSDTDLPEDIQKKLREKEENLQFQQAEKMRQEAWDKSDLFPKLKKAVKGAWYGDKRDKDK